MSQEQQGSEGGLSVDGLNNQGELSSDTALVVDSGDMHLSDHCHTRRSPMCYDNIPPNRTS